MMKNLVTTIQLLCAKILIIFIILYSLSVISSCNKENCIDEINDTDVIKLTEKSLSYFHFTGNEKEFIYKTKYGETVRNLKLETSNCYNIDYYKYPNIYSSNSEFIKTEYREIRFYDEQNGSSGYIYRNIVYRLETRIHFEEGEIQFYDRYTFGGNINKSSSYFGQIITDERTLSPDIISNYKGYIIHDSLALNNKIFKNVYEFNSSNKKETLYFSPELGIIGFINHYEGISSKGKLFVLDKVVY